MKRRKSMDYSVILCFFYIHNLKGIVLVPLFIFGRLLGFGGVYGFGIED